jgi:GT2 family glycosyltransferase
MKSEIKRSAFQGEKVDIIIPFHGEQGKLSNLIQNIIFCVRSNPYRITVVDDASPEQTVKDSKGFVEELQNFDKNRPSGTIPILQAIRSNTQLGFGGAVRYGLQHTTYPWVLVMHSDVTVNQPNFMCEMGKSLLRARSEKVGLVTARSNNPKTGDPRVKGDPNPNDDIILTDNYAPLFCFMCPRELFQRIGGLSEYPYTGYEDEEFYHRMKVKGFKQAICGKSWVKHEGGGTMKKLLKDKSICEEVEKNRDRCIADLKYLYS